MHNHCINKLLNIEDVIVKNVIHAKSFVKSCWKPGLKSIPVQHVADLQKESMTTECRQSKIYRFK